MCPESSFVFDKVTHQYNRRSGESNVAYWLERHGVPASTAAIKRVFAAAKSANRLLSSEEIMHAARGSEAT